MTIVEDPNYNPAAAPIAVTPVQVTEPEPVVEEPEQYETIIIKDDGLQITLNEKTKTSLIVILSIIAVMILCCFGVGCTLMFCYNAGMASK